MLKLPKHVYNKVLDRTQKQADLILYCSVYLENVFKRNIL